MGLLQRVLQNLRTRLHDAKAGPGAAEAHRLIDQGQAAEKADRLDEARRCYEQAVALAPRLSKAHMNLGNAYRAAGAIDQAFASYRTAVELEPESAAAHYNLGNAYWQMNQPDAALRSYLKSSELDPKFDLPWIAIAVTLANMGRVEDAIEACLNAIRIEPQNAESRLVLGMIYHGAGRLDDCIASMRLAIKTKPDHLSALTSLAHYLQEAFRFEEAQGCYRRAIEISPHSLPLNTGLLFLLSEDPAIDGDALFREHVAVGKRLGFALGERDPAPEHARADEPERPLRIGFVSADLRNHPVMLFFQPMLRKLAQRTDFSLHAYHGGTSEDEVTAAVRPLFAQWHAVAALSDDALAEQIRQDRIDILIDLSGHTIGNRLAVFARKPAPIQASWIGYPGTTGVEAVDYFIGDPHYVPTQPFAAQFSEKLVHLPRASAFEAPPNAPAVNPLPTLSGRPFTFASFNRPTKINRRMVALWAAILRQVPDARMSLAGIMDDYQPAILKQWFADEQVDASRLIFHRRCSVEAYLQLHHDVDLCLDTFPYSGGITTLQALWMGVPTLTLPGTTPASRHCASLLTHVQLDGFVAPSADDFVRLGAEWARRTTELADIRANLRQRMAASPLCDADLIGACLARALRIMWRRWCAGEPVEQFEVLSAD
jgi:predicted O-linked N-acetylglucosamine transferase (SPINDLY family)